jgi:hypothetical protein
LNFGSGGFTRLSEIFALALRRKRGFFAEAEQYAADLRNNSSFDPSFSELADMTEVEDPQIDYASAARFARDIDPFSHTSKRAVVAPRPPMYETARMYKVIRNDENIALFKTIDEAKNWLGLEESATECDGV